MTLTSWARVRARVELRCEGGEVDGTMGATGSCGEGRMGWDGIWDGIWGEGGQGRDAMNEWDARRAGEKGARSSDRCLMFGLGNPQKELGRRK